MTSDRQPGGVLEATVQALSQTGDDALTKALAGGLPDRRAVAEWTARAKLLLQTQREPGALRSELHWLSDSLRALLAPLPLPEGLSPERVVERFLPRLASVRALVAEDVEAAFEGDPAARGFAEIVVAYPSLRAITVYRIAHELHVLGVPILPRMMTEYAHDKTGIDIHPGAVIGRRFFIDHGTGVVVGETTVIGDRVRLYQGVTLGAKAPRHGAALRGVKRHPTIEDDVTIYAGATILGGDTVIGRGSVIGGNVWLLESVDPCSKVMAKPADLERERNADCEEKARQLRWDL